MTKFFLLTLSFLILFQPSDLSATDTSTIPVVDTYEELVSAIRQAMNASRARIEQAVEFEKVREAWETGKLIDAHILKHQERADYATHVMIKLATDLNVGERELYYMLGFARTYPILPAPSELSWSHYRELLAISDPNQRQEIADRAVKEKWGHKRLREEVNRVSHKNKDIEILQATLGKLYTYRIIRATAGKYNGQLVIDLGFSNYYRPEKKLNFKEGDIVQVVKGKLKKLDRGSDADRYTYEADIFRVIDGDTFIAVIDLGFGFNTVQKLRLRGLDAPEIERAVGVEAKEFLERKLQGQVQTTKNGPVPIIIRTSKSDKYDRYLADLFVNGEYVNQKLVEHELADIVED